MTTGLYTIKNINTNTLYVGSSVNVYKRLRVHKSLLRGNKHHCTHLQRAWNKYGEKCFEFIVNKTVDTEEKVRELEQAVIDIYFDSLYNSKNTVFGAALGDANPMRNPEVAKKISESRKGMVFSEQHLENMRKARKGLPSNMKGHKHSDSSKEKMRLAKLGKPSNREGKKASDETKLRISLAKQGVKRGKYKIITCVHCGKQGGGGAMYQFHNDNCKFKGD
jgi:group I intron endonuclease